MKFKITEAKVYMQPNGDRVVLTTDLPKPRKSPTCVCFTCDSGDGITFVKKHYDITPDLYNFAGGLVKKGSLHD